MTTNPKRLAILVGGGPAPGVNSVIGAVTIRAINGGIDVIGIRDGFKWIMRGDISHFTRLSIESVSRIHFSGGAHIGIARDNPTKDKKYLESAVTSLLRLNVDKLITIGGDDTAYSAMRLEEMAAGRIRVVHIPKTIDNDLDLPLGICTFGYQTARHVGVEIVKHFMVDALTTSRWFFVVSMGRKAGHLALGIGKAAGATLTLIPEEFPPGHIRLSHVVDILVGAIVKRLSYGRPDGVVMLAEGLVERIDPKDLDIVLSLERDAHDNLRLSEISFGEILKYHVQERLQSFGLKTTIIAKNLGYEMRCADPIPFDMEYTRDLGYCAAQFILEGGNAAMVSIQEGHFVPLYFKDILDPATSRARVRMVDIRSEYYQIGRSYMIRLDKDDFNDPHELAKFAATCRISIDEFRKRFNYLIENDLLYTVLEEKKKKKEAPAEENVKNQEKVRNQEKVK
ncbi:MAG: 6-phosphofructokinase [Candidatus Latescibacteria bacterium]|nr:6-phosphofructokinase [Candidatus Latescibacterota bacterium]NIO00946.1 6-phosphofructokinase [Candidatus Latescibacterota bacterium]NIO27345.1 6-phosphofructokinase [Candidatus Latescibacterota bacterium]NIO54867.1 6-phosphofructokinase [Candidatus Latescibacterota bacterium]NIT00956.1 6-phosphofructokinase [Candidatus Latescibacterota bacterium]